MVSNYNVYVLYDSQSIYPCTTTLLHLRVSSTEEKFLPSSVSANNNTAGEVGNVNRKLVLHSSSSSDSSEFG